MAQSGVFFLLLALVGISFAYTSIGGLEQRLTKAQEEAAQAQLLSSSLPVQFFSDTNVTARIASFGYPVQEFTVTTQDDFILKIQRIPYGRTNRTTGHRPVVLLQHGILDTAFTWLAQPYANQILPFLLAEAGFDVFLSNIRCNQVSMSHIRYTPADPQFWDWTMDQMAQYDVPAILTGVLGFTGAKSLSYIGHSQGTTIAWAALSRDFEGASGRVNLFISLAPVVYLGNSPSLILNAMAKLGVDQLFKLLGVKQFLPDNKFIDKLIPGFCEIFPSSCNFFICLLAGCEKGNIDDSTLNFMLNHFPAPTSVKNMVRWAQAIRSGKFQMYDYGNNNQRYYGQPTPPIYVPTNITCQRDGTGACNVALFYGGKDKLGDPTDVQGLISSLNAARNIKVRAAAEFPSWGHGDFVWGETTAQLLYTSRIIPLLRQAANEWK